MSDRLFSETIFHCSKAHSSLLAMKLRQQLPPTLSEKWVHSTDNPFNSYVKSFTDRYSTRSDVAVLPVIGEMSRYTYWSYGNEFLAKCLEEIQQNTQYKGVVLKIDTPGGTADSCALLADAVAHFAKPILAQTNFCASAGVFVASQCNEIWLEPQASTQFGSVGTLIIYENYQGYLEKAGIQLEMIRAEGSEDKASINPYEELTEEKRAELVARATEANKEFLGYVRRGRAGKITSEECLSGKMYNAKSAIQYGLADRMGTLKEAVNRVISLSK